MERKIVIADDFVKVYDSSGAKDKKLGSIETSTLSSMFLGGNRAPMGLMAPAIRWVNTTGTAFLVERPPTYTTIAYSHTAQGNADGSELHSFTIPMPWMTYLVSFADVQLNYIERMMVTCRTEPIRSMSDSLFRVPLPNIMHDHSACLGYDFNEAFAAEMVGLRANGNWTGSAATMAAINMFWDGVFNRDVWITKDIMPLEHAEDSKLAFDAEEGYIHNRKWLEKLSKLSLEQALSLTYAEDGIKLTVERLTSWFDKENHANYPSVSDVVLTLMNQAK